MLPQWVCSLSFPSPILFCFLFSWCSSVYPEDAQLFPLTWDRQSWIDSFWKFIGPRLTNHPVLAVYVSVFNHRFKRTELSPNLGDDMAVRGWKYI